MIVRRLLVVLIAAAFIGSGPASAQTDRQAIEKSRLESGKQELQRDRGYILFSVPTKIQYRFFKEPDAEDRAAYDAYLAEEVGEARKGYPRQLARWKRDVDRGKATEADRPAEPNRDNVRAVDIRQRLMTRYNVHDPYVKEKDAEGKSVYRYLLEVDPGIYTFHGGFDYVSGAGGCMCMGSLKFEVPAGRITNVGDMFTTRWARLEARMKAGPAFDYSRSPPIRPIDYSVPPRLAKYGVENADFRAAGKTPNFFGVFISRMPEVEGVLAYEGDIPIDVKGQREAEAAQAGNDAADAAAKMGAMAGSMSTDASTEATVVTEDVPTVAEAEPIN